MLSRSGVRGGRLYYFFKSKEELLRAVLEQYVSLLHPIVIDPAFATTDDPIERVFAVLAGYRAGLVLTECRHGCPIARIALETTEASDETRRWSGSISTTGLRHPDGPRPGGRPLTGGRRP